LKIDFRYNKIGNKGVKELYLALKHLLQLNKIVLLIENNKIDNKTYIKIKEELMATFS